MANSGNANAWDKFWAKLNELTEKKKSTFTVIALVFLSAVLLLASNPIITWIAAAVAAILTVLKAIWSNIGSVAETEAQEEHDDVLVNPNASDDDKEASAANLRSKTSMKRNYDIKASVCELFATITGIPAVVTVVASVYPF